MSVTAQKSTQATAHDAVPKEALNWYDIGGFLRFCRFTFLQVGAGDATSTGLLCYVPANALIIPYLGKVYTSDFGSSSQTMHVGTAADADLFVSSLAVVSADNSCALDEAHVIGVAATDLSNGVLTTAETAIYATFNVAAIPDAAKVQGFVAFLAE
jgi:hypothetical protein